MEEGVVWSLPETTSAAEDCNEEVPERMGKAEAGAKAAKGAIAGKPPARCPSLPHQGPLAGVQQPGEDADVRLP